MAKRYKFRFETLIRVRRQREEEQKRNVASRLRKIQHLQRQQRSMMGRLDEQVQMTREALIGEAVDMDQLKLGRGWMVRLRRGILETDAQIATQKVMLAQERVNLAGAVCDRKILSRLKDRRYQRYLHEQDRREQAEMDEISLLGFHHNAVRRGNEAS